MRLLLELAAKQVGLSSDFLKEVFSGALLHLYPDLETYGAVQLSAEQQALRDVVYAAAITGAINVLSRQEDWVDLGDYEVPDDSEG